MSDVQMWRVYVKSPAGWTTIPLTVSTAVMNRLVRTYVDIGGGVRVEAVEAGDA